MILKVIEAKLASACKGDGMSIAEADALAASFPFPRVGDIDNMSPSDVRASGWSSPFHGKCFVEGTEVYTNCGWVDFKDLAAKALYISRKADGELEWVRAVKRVEYQYSGPVYRLQTNSFDLCVTPDHSQPFEARVSRGKLGRKYELFLEPIEKMLALSEYRIPRTGWWKGKYLPDSMISKFAIKGASPCTLLEFAEFMGYYLSEGSTTLRKDGTWQISIAQDERKIYMMKQAANKVAGFGNCHFGDGKIYIFNSALAQYLIGFGKSHEKWVPRAIKDAVPEVVYEFLSAYLLGDGSESSSNWFSKELITDRKRFYTSSSRMTTDIGELILKVGGYPSFGFSAKAGDVMHCPKTQKKYRLNHDVIRIGWNRSKNATSQAMKVTRELYTGFVRDVELERNHVLWVRFNGKTCFSGNCRCETVMLWTERATDVTPVEPKPMPPATPDMLKKKWNAAEEKLQNELAAYRLEHRGEIVGNPSTWIVAQRGKGQRWTSLHDDILKTRAAWIDSLPAADRLAERSKIFDGMIKTRPTKMKRGLDSGIVGMRTRMLLDLERNELAIVIRSGSGRAGFQTIRGPVIELFSKDAATVVAHELSHAVDSLMCTGGRGFSAKFGYWKDNPLHVGFEDGAKSSVQYKKWHAKQHSGTKGSYKNGDGDYWKNNWIDNYEGRIYFSSEARGTGFGEEWWAVNSERYSQYCRDLQAFDKSVSRLVKKYPNGIKEATNDFMGLNYPTKQWLRGDMTYAEARIEYNLRKFGNWQAVKNRYPELAKFMEKVYEAPKMPVGLKPPKILGKVGPKVKVTPKKVPELPTAPRVPTDTKQWLMDDVVVGDVTAEKMADLAIKGEWDILEVVAKDALEVYSHEVVVHNLNSMNFARYLTEMKVPTKEIKKIMAQYEKRIHKLIYGEG